MRFATLSVTLFAALATAIFIVTLFPPTVRTPLALPRSQPADKVLIFDYILSGYVTINEGTDHILAVSKAARQWAADGLLNRIYPAMDRIPAIGSTFIPDPEQILYLQPDIVFARDWQIDLLKDFGVPGLCEVRDDSQHPIQYRTETWKTMGETTGKSIRVTALLDRYSAKRAAVQMRLPTDAARQTRVTYIHVYDGWWLTTNSDYYLAYKLGLAGAQNVGKGLDGEAELEQLLLLDPDIILFASISGDRTNLREIVERPEFQALRAVRTHRIYKLPEHTYMNEPIEDPLLLRWMAEVFYPDRMPQGLREEYRETYREVYGYAISDDEIDRAIFLKENFSSAGYARFQR